MQNIGAIQANEKLHGIFFCSVDLLTGWQMKWIESSFFGRKCHMRKKKERRFCYIMLLNHLLYSFIDRSRDPMIYTYHYICKGGISRICFFLFSLVESQKPKENMEVCEAVISYAAITITIFLRYQFVTTTEYTIVVL